MLLHTGLLLIYHLFSDKVATGSFDKTCKLWNAQTGQCYFTYRGHTSEIVCLSFNPQSTIIATGSMDATSKLWDVQSGNELATLAVSLILGAFWKVAN